MSKVPVEYNTNNSGGSYWLKKRDWQALQSAGWLIMDRDNAVHVEGNYAPDKSGLPKVSKPADLENAHYAFKLFNNIQEAIAEFEELTGQDVTDEGCNCCGAPHSFTWGKDIVVRLPKERLDEQDYNYASGEDLLEYMFPSKPDMNRIEFHARVVVSKEQIKSAKFDIIASKRKAQAAEIGIWIAKTKGWNMEPVEDLAISSMNLFIFTPNELKDYVDAAIKQKLIQFSERV